MLEKFFTAPVNTPFLIALAIMTALSLLVVASSFFGGAVDAEIDGAIDTPGEQVMDWLGITSTPSSIVVVVVSTTFFLTGFLTQWIAFSQTGAFLNGWIAVAPALIVTLLATRGTGRLFKRLKVKEHTTAVHADSFVGKVARVTGGTARVGLPAQAKLVDEHGQTHYVLVEPATESEVFPDGVEVLLLQRRGPKFLAVSQSLDDLRDVDLETLTQKLNQKK